MSGLLHPWRDALQDLGLMGLVPPALSAVEKPQIRPSALPELPLRPLGAVTRVVHPIQEPQPQDHQAFPPKETVQTATTLTELQERIAGCMACPLGACRVRFVFGEGAPRAPMMFIGEGPGRDEDLQGRPFVGRAGELLEKMIKAIGFERSEVYIANVVKCRPPDNRTPTPQEAQRCLPYLRRQIELIQPKVIVTLGATPLRELIGVTSGITHVRGQWKRLDMLGGIPVMPTFHPAYVLRQYTQEVRRAVWGDLQAARKWLDESAAPSQTSASQ